MTGVPDQEVLLNKDRVDVWMKKWTELESKTEETALKLLYLGVCVYDTRVAVHDVGMPQKAGSRTCVTSETAISPPSNTTPRQ